MRVAVDRQACEANGLCESIAPEVFELDDEDTLHVTAEPESEVEERVRQAVDTCPKVALSLHEG